MLEIIIFFKRNFLEKNLNMISFLPIQSLSIIYIYMYAYILIEQ